MDVRNVPLVEDNPDDVQPALIAFKEIEFPHKIVVARDGADALDYLFRRGANPCFRKPTRFPEFPGFANQVKHLVSDLAPQVWKDRPLRRSLTCLSPRPVTPPEL